MARGNDVDVDQRRHRSRRAQGNQVLKIFGVDGSWVYFVLGGRLQRVPADGSGPPENVAFAPGNCPIGDLTADGGRVMWTDACAGGAYIVEP